MKYHSNLTSSSSAVFAETGRNTAWHIKKDMVTGRRRDWARDAAEEWDHIAHPSADRWRLLWEKHRFPYSLCQLALIARRAEQIFQPLG
ncbi:hypothetical protein [Yoonia vestfoldensis]|uniref:hypothetical protein n=1 Tax=Yoonia vestfoldensis TaxID=245188 RepID=UPI000B3AC9B0|nr:hypothetical protein [Yoonia vestfoldensis]